MAAALLFGDLIPREAMIASTRGLRCRPDCLANGVGEPGARGSELRREREMSSAGGF